MSKKELGVAIKLARKIKSKKIGKKYTQEMLAKDLGISRSYLGDIESGRIYPSFVLLSKIAEICEVPLSSFEYKNNPDINKLSDVDLSESIPFTPDDIVNLPIVGAVRAGQPILAVENIEGHFPAPKKALSPGKEYFFLRVKGDSMNLEFKEGTLLLIEKTPVIENGQIGVVLIDGCEATVKKVVINDNMITLIPMSSNPEHTPMMYNIVEDQVEIIGRVKMAIKTY